MKTIWERCFIKNKRSELFPLYTLGNKLFLYVSKGSVFFFFLFGAPFEKSSEFPASQHLQRPSNSIDFNAKLREISLGIGMAGRCALFACKSHFGAVPGNKSWIAHKTTRDIRNLKRKRNRPIYNKKSRVNARDRICFLFQTKKVVQLLCRALLNYTYAHTYEAFALTKSDRKLAQVRIASNYANSAIEILMQHPKFAAQLKATLFHLFHHLHLRYIRLLQEFSILQKHF